MGNLNERLDNLRVLLETPEFLEGKGLSNEVNIRIFCYDPKDEMAVRHLVEKLSLNHTLNCNIKEFNLYKVFLSICEDKKILDRIPAMEEKKGSNSLLTTMHKSVTVDMFTKKIQYESHAKGDVLLLTGVGEVYPFMRVHTLLNALQPLFTDMPILVMYPGKFDGSYLRLFDKFVPNPYYRAFNVL